MRQFLRRLRVLREARSPVCAGNTEMPLLPKSCMDCGAYILYIIHYKRHLECFFFYNTSLFLSPFIIFYYLKVFFFLEVITAIIICLRSKLYLLSIFKCEIILRKLNKPKNQCTHQYYRLLLLFFIILFLQIFT